MKRIAVTLSVCTLFIAACGDNSNSSTNGKYEDGSNQVQEPVLNSGPETEQERATDAVRDSSIRNDSNSVRSDSSAQLLPH